MWNERSQTVPQFKLLSKIIELELLMTRFVRSLREGDFPLYARWLPVHVEFMKGNAVVQKSRRKFCLVAKDQAHEQSNESIQTKEGAAGLYENLMLFMLGGPDCARMVEEFEAIHDPPPSSAGHHEEGRSLREGSRAAWQPFHCSKSGAGT